MTVHQKRGRTRTRAVAAGIITVLAFAPAPAAAQQDSTRVLTAAGLPCTFDSCVLRLEDGWFSRKLVRGAEGTVVARLGFGGPSLENIVAISDSAVVHARRYRSAQNRGAVLTTIGSLGTLAAIVMLNQREGDVRDESIAVNVAGLALWAVGRTFQLEAHRELERSLWWYNRTVTGGGASGASGTTGTTGASGVREPAGAVVRPGIETFLADLPPRLRGKRVALITNHTGVDRAGTPDIDLVASHPDLELVALLAPEHGIRGDLMDGVKLGDEVDPETGVPVYSLYRTENGVPTPEMLRNVDVLVYDLQEVGGRTWTYVSTMALAMRAAAEKGIPFVVLDRPNPIGGEIVEGALLDTAYASFVGMYPIPARHGMTVGELATLFNREHGIGADLVVARVSGWRRSQWQDETGLPWVNPSPNLRSLAAVTSYPGTVYFEGTTLSEGRGTDRPFEQVGAPWLDAPAVVRAMNARQLPGVRFEATTTRVLPTAAKHPGQTIPAIRYVVTDRQAYRPVRTALLLIDEIHRRHPEDFAWTGTIDRLTGSDRVRRAVEEGWLPRLLDAWDREAAAFRNARAPYLLYP